MIIRVTLIPTRFPNNSFRKLANKRPSVLHPHDNTFLGKYELVFNQSGNISMMIACSQVELELP